MTQRRSTLGDRPSIFRKTDEVIPELEQSDAQTAKSSDAQKSKRQRIKVTVYLEPEDVIVIDELQIKEFKETGKKPEKSEIVSRAIQAFRGLNS
jgi:hypothetical protein